MTGMGFPKDGVGAQAVVVLVAALFAAAAGLMVTIGVRAADLADPLHLPATLYPTR
jgi:hypothetical protein